MWIEYKVEVLLIRKCPGGYCECGGPTTKGCIAFGINVRGVYSVYPRFDR